MKSKRLFAIASAVVVLIIASLACVGFGSPAEPTPTPVPIQVNTPLPPPTEKPTLAPEPTVEAPPTEPAPQVDEEFQALLEKFSDKGYVSTTEGELTELEPFKESSAEFGWKSYWSFDFVISDFVFKAHYKWSSAVDTKEYSGCGIMFGLQENGNSYGVFLDRSRIYFTLVRGSFYYDVGKTSGRGSANFGNPAEADFAISVKGQNAYVLIDNTDFTAYTLSQDQTTNGQFALTLINGTPRDYGTRCEMTDIKLWTPKE